MAVVNKLRCMQRIQYLLPRAITSIRKYAMTHKEFRQRGKEMVDYICEYRDTIKNRKVAPDVKPGYLRKLIPPEAPDTPESWDELMCDIEEKIMPGILHWNHPRFHAYFSSGDSYPTLMADMFADMSGGLASSWGQNPAIVELEQLMMDWWGRALELPDEFIHECNLGGGGVLQNSGSDCTFAGMVAARQEALICLREEDSPNNSENPKHLNCYLPKLVAYTSTQSHSCIEKAAKTCVVKIRKIQPNDKYELTGDLLDKAMREDEECGLRPFYVAACACNTGPAAFDKVDEIAEVCRCRNHKIWINLEASHAGTCLLNAENRKRFKGIEHVHSFTTNGNNLMLALLECSGLWIKDYKSFCDTFQSQSQFPGKQDIKTDLTDWGVPINRRIRPVKLWFLFRWYGIEGLQAHVRHHQCLAKYLEDLIKRDNRFEILNDVYVSSVCFRLCGPDELTIELYDAINKSRELHVTFVTLKHKSAIRFCVCYENATQAHIDCSWQMIQQYATEILNKKKKKEKEECK